LASRSRTRSAILANAGVAFEIEVSEFDETQAKRGLLEQGMTPIAIAGALAELKALAVSRARPGLVIGADQTLDLAGVLFDKADDLHEARRRLAGLRGRRHALHAGLAIAEQGAIVWRETQTAWLTMRSFSEDFLEGYLARNGHRILSSVGCYQLEGEGVQLFEKIEGDYFTILGLPLFGLLAFLRRAGAVEA
jgi:septum formation protein